MVRRRYVRQKPHGLHDHCSSVAVSVHATAVSWSKTSPICPTWLPQFPPVQFLKPCSRSAAAYWAAKPPVAWMESLLPRSTKMVAGCSSRTRRHIDSCANNTKSENMVNSMATRSYVRQKSDRRKGQRQSVSMSTRSHTVLKVFLGSSHFGLRIHVIAEPYSIGDTPLALGPRRCHGLSLDIAKSCSIDDDSQHSFRRKVAVLAPRGRGRAAASYDGSRSN